MTKRKKLNPDPQPIDHGTPETQRKLRQSPLFTLQKRNYLTAEQVQAAWEIEAAYTVITFPVRLRMMSWSDWIQSSNDHSAHMTARQQTQIDWYNKWVDACDERGWSLGPVLDIVVDGRGIGETARRRNTHWTTLKTRLRACLALYCQVRGWSQKTA